MRRETYIRAHDRLLNEMRVQVRRKNRRGIESTGRRLHRLRIRYRAKFAA